MKTGDLSIIPSISETIINLTGPIQGFMEGAQQIFSSRLLASVLFIACNLTPYCQDVKGYPFKLYSETTYNDSVSICVFTFGNTAEIAHYIKIFVSTNSFYD